ncbi:MAG: gliding motility-associated C-terminal domain-containing protein [Adhaeribacter sp.]
MRYGLLFLLLLLFLVPAQATHIVGGEFQLTHTAGTTYQLTLNLYFDNVNGNRGAIEPVAPVFVFEKGTNRLVNTYNLPLKSQTSVAYTSVACTSPSLSTDKITYTSSLVLSAQSYSHPAGYYAVWERCCRNNVISNIVQPQNAGQVFYIEFPPVRLNNQPFLNSSPALFPPLSDYACLNDLFYYDFGGIDPDGDSLVYEMVTPLNGNTSAQMPLPAGPLPSPYLPVTWTAGLGIQNQIPGNPSVAIDRQTGRLTLRPSRLGLFVFGVRCSEYRNQVKIGEVRRDFQLMVLNCPKNEAPQVEVRLPGQRQAYQEGQVIRLSGAGSRCLDLFVSDTEANAALRIEAKPVNFKLSDQIMSLTSGVVNRNGGKDTLKTTACFPACLTSAGKTFQMDFIVSDNGCSLPKMDTVRVSFVVDPVSDQAPSVRTTAPSQVLRPKLGETLDFNVLGLDADLDLVTLSAKGQNFNLADQGILFSAVNGKGSSTGRFRWPIDCRAMSQPSYLLEFTASTGNCGQPLGKSVTVEVQPDYRNQAPRMLAAMAGKVIEIADGATFRDTIFCSDADLHLLALTARGQDFELDGRDMAFVTTAGAGQAKGIFTWTPACQVTPGGSYTVNFTLTESACQASPPQTMSVTFKVASQQEAPFLPANIFTPNQDGQNDYFQLPNLPRDYCGSSFALIKIFNRWGTQVYESQDRNFKWSGKGVADGVYFYQIYYSDKQFKGMVTVVR